MSRRCHTVCLTNTHAHTHRCNLLNPKYIIIHSANKLILAYSGPISYKHIYKTQFLTNPNDADTDTHSLVAQRVGVVDFYQTVCTRVFLNEKGGGLTKE